MKKPGQKFGVIASIVLIAAHLSSAGIVSGQKHGMGAELDLEGYQNHPGIATFARRDSSDLPEKVDLSAYAPKPGDQGKTGTCVGWATAYHGRTILDAIRESRLGATKNEEEAFSPSFVYNQIRDEPGCKLGTSVGDAVDLMRRKGALKAMVKKFDCDFENWDRYEKLSRPFRIKNSLKLHPPFANNKVLPVKKALSERQPVIIGMHLVDSFHDIGNDGWFKPSTAEKKEKFTRKLLEAKGYKGHAMAVVGYDDSKGKSGAFRLINSWGTDWGDDGFCWVSYEDFNNYVSKSYSLIDFPIYKDDITGTLVMETEKGVRMEGRYAPGDAAYTLAEKHEAGTRFRIYLKNDGPTYLYAFGFDQTGSTFKLFPHSGDVSPYIPYNEAHVPIPDDDHFIEIDDEPGRNDLCVIYSTVELPIDELLTRIGKRGKDLIAKSTPLREAVEQELEKLGVGVIPDDRTNYDPDLFEFKSRRADEICVPLIIRFGR